EIASLQQQLMQSNSSSQQEKLKDQIQKRNQAILSYRDSIEKKNPNNFLTTLFRAMKEPAIPAAPKQTNGKYDSTYAFEYYKSNYWKDVSFTHDRLIRTPILEPKLDKYFRDLVAPDPDSISREVDYLLLLSRSSPEMFKYLMVYFVQKYINPEYMGQDAVF